MAVRATATKLLGAGSAPVWFAGVTGSPLAAAWANSAAASSLDLDDGHRLARGHPGAAVIPAAFAVAEETSAGLEELITAIVIGYEVGVTIAFARTAYGSTGTWATYAVVATCAALRGTPQDVLEHALAIAGESAPNQLFSSAPPFSLPTPEGSDLKEGIPWSVVTGMLALELAEEGFTGPRNLLESTLFYNFRNAPALGEAQHICTSYFKLYACCRHIHPPIDASLQLIRQHSIDAKDIEKIDVETYSGALRITNKTHPISLVDVQYSIPFCLALVAVYGPSALLPLASDVLTLEALPDLARKVSVTLDAEIDSKFPAQTLARVTITSKGQRFTSEITAPRGEGGDPLSWLELEDKFTAVTQSALSDDQRRSVFGAIERLRDDGDLRQLQACLSELS
ncbi:2-methylcitrate dehydratase [Burkholderia sp. Leaf177]|nr:2-methylcitrate dehydratase [Burkholderia sp. Leaf177]